MTEIEYQLYSQRGAELRAQAAHQRLVAQARQVRRARQGGTGPLGRLTASLRRVPRQAHRVRVVSTAGSAGVGEC
ncbi:hypothetical protein [Kitasatospora kifunensis]|uniref:Uncharacterized protein n=1 Tax=Kitasatospora kifunensis TaxID=58351 RepID=A0A7W7R1C0_KITKI|nr:hypothetical protein [Kitasatospora kifunensis]MBB4923420.1 hypothetical protein [Kitasatospora kifunensis]